MDRQLARSKLIFVDGIDGSGKSTFVRMLSDHIIGAGSDVYSTSVIAKDRMISGAVRAKLIDSNQRKDGILECLGVLAAHRELYIDVIVPKLEEGAYVIVDRSIASFIAYQIYGGEDTISGMSSDLLTTLLYQNNFIANPGWYIYCKCDQSIIDKRIVSRGDSNHFDDADRELKNKIRRGFDDYYHSATHKENGTGLVRVNTGLDIKQMNTIANITANTILRG